MITELIAMAVWATLFTTRVARIAFLEQTVKLRPVMKKFRSGLLPALLVVAAFAPGAYARNMPGPESAGSTAEPTREFAVQRDGISLNEAVSRAEAQYNARVVRTDVVDEDGRKVYVLKLLSEKGRVFTVRIDANSGRMR
ncbi:MAG: PepSY domain-containing protein [Pseudomonadota bacterium]